jgi:hypothetical protein
VRAARPFDRLRARREDRRTGGQRSEPQSPAGRAYGLEAGPEGGQRSEIRATEVGSRIDDLNDLKGLNDFNDLTVSWLGDATIRWKFIDE